ncbi:MAG TPA: DUF2752 domain-containing protein [Draconibacterium sp.]|nr:DUF2752 domain-containing protein [Draconibacterium sp.]
MKRSANIILLVIILIVSVLFYLIDPIQHSLFPQCLFHSLTGGYCPGCGSQRALHSLLHLDFAGVAGYNFLFLPAALLILYHYIHPVLNKTFAWKLPNLLYRKPTPWIILGIVVLFWIARNLPWYPFNLLAPTN